MPTIEQEITQLEEQIAEKRAALGVEGKNNEKLPSEKEMLHRAIGEKIQQQIPKYSPAPKPLPALPSDDVDETPSYSEQEFKDKVQEFVNVVFNKSLEEGIDNVSKSNNPALIDAFHDILADELYNMLVDRKKLEQIK